MRPANPFDCEGEWRKDRVHVTRRGSADRREGAETPAIRWRALGRKWRPSATPRSLRWPRWRRHTASMPTPWPAGGSIWSSVCRQATRVRGSCDRAADAVLCVRDVARSRSNCVAGSEGTGRDESRGPAKTSGMGAPILDVRSKTLEVSSSSS